jgi:mRNA interferase RelE/StbE
MYRIEFDDDVRQQIQKLPGVIQIRMNDVLMRVARWPNVSGVKPLRGKLKGVYRIRTGDYRLLFSVELTAKIIRVRRVANRRDVYEDEQ